MGCSTFSEYTVIAAISLAKVRGSDRRHLARQGHQPATAPCHATLAPHRANLAPYQATLAPYRATPPHRAHQVSRAAPLEKMCYPTPNPNPTPTPQPGQCRRPSGEDVPLGLRCLHRMGRGVEHLPGGERRSNPNPNSTLTQP
eukprot:scaffold81164_cov35-Phaeocystis_antarctica.AAC.2